MDFLSWRQKIFGYYGRYYGTVYTVPRQGNQMALVDSFLLARKFIQRWQQADNSDGVFWKYVTALLPQLAQEYGGGGPTRSLGHRRL